MDSLSCCSRRNSITSMYSTTSTSAVSQVIDTQDHDSVRNLIRPELRQPLPHPVYQPRGITQLNSDDKSEHLSEERREIHQGARSGFSTSSRAQLPEETSMNI